MMLSGEMTMGGTMENGFVGDFDGEEEMTTGSFDEEGEDVGVIMASLMEASATA
jgi:hypothetical protein